MPLASLVEWIYLHLPVSDAPPQFTPSRLRLVTSWRTFNTDRATKLLGYSPIISLEVYFIKVIDMLMWGFLVSSALPFSILDLGRNEANY